MLATYIPRCLTSNHLFICTPSTIITYRVPTVCSQARLDNNRKTIIANLTWAVKYVVETSVIYEEHNEVHSICSSPSPLFRA